MKLLNKANLAPFLERLRPEFEVVAPLYEGQDILFGDLDSLQLATEFIGKPRLSPKEYLFPQRERLFTFNVCPESIEIEAHFNETKRVIWVLDPVTSMGLSSWTWFTSKITLTLTIKHGEQILYF